MSVALMIENALRHRGARLVAVSFIILTAGFAFHPYLTSDVGTKAAVNAPLTRHIAPFDGTVALLPSAGSVNTKPVSLKLMNFFNAFRAAGRYSSSNRRGWRDNNIVTTSTCGDGP